MSVTWLQEAINMVKFTGISSTKYNVFTVVFVSEDSKPNLITQGHFIQF